MTVGLGYWPQYKLSPVGKYVMMYVCVCVCMLCVCVCVCVLYACAHVYCIIHYLEIILSFAWLVVY